MAKRGVLACAYGVPSTIWSNQEIARIASIHAQKEVDARIFTQLDIQMSPDLRRHAVVEYLPDEDPQNPPPTLRICRWTARRAIQEGLTELIVVAGRPHIWRVMRDMEEAVKEIRLNSLLVKPAPEIWDFPEEKWYCADSTQKRTQSRENWREREAILEMLPFMVYREIAK